MNFSYKKTLDMVNEKTLAEMTDNIALAHKKLHSKTGVGSEFLGWLELPRYYDKEEFVRIKHAAARIRENSDVLVVVGIGGSYLGARAAIEFLKSPLHNLTDKPQVLFAGTNLSPSDLSGLLNYLRDKEVSVNVISKSGTTTESAIAFRFFRNFMEEKYGPDEARRRIYATTDKSRGALRELAETQGYETFVVPNDIGGRYSVLTAVGLLPIAVAGCNIDAIMAGANDAREYFFEPSIMRNECYQYAAGRNILYKNGKKIEILASFEPSTHYFTEWWKQLYGESEGKSKGGIFPAGVDFSADLHSMGQYIQDGERIIFETFFKVENSESDLSIPPMDGPDDGLGFLNNKKMSYINHRALMGTVLAHNNGGVPAFEISIERQDEYNLGYLAYFFMKACGMSGYIRELNPFDQPGVEEYKKNIFALLGKPGYEDLGEELKIKL